MYALMSAYDQSEFPRYPNLDLSNRINETMNKLLIIANYKYKYINDLSGIDVEVDELEDTFSKLDYTVDKILNATAAILEREVNQFLQSCKPNDTVVIYYSGHGFSRDNDNYIVCIDYMKTSLLRNQQGGEYNLNEIINFEGVPHMLLVVDACRVDETLPHVKEPETNMESPIAQIYSTSINRKATNDHIFCKAFSNACMRYQLTLTQICEEIHNEYILNKRTDAAQKVVYIAGPNDDRIILSSAFNSYVEKCMYDDIIDIYKKIQQINEDDYLSIDELYNKAYNEDEIPERILPENYIKKILQEYITGRKKYQFISCLLRFPIHGITIYKDEFSIKGRNGSYSFQNDHLYEYVNFVCLIKKSCTKIRDSVFRMDANTIAVIWDSAISITFDNASLIDIGKYFHLTGAITNSSIINMVDNGVIISSPINTDGSSFLQAIIQNSIYSGDMILYICHNERIKIHNTISISINEFLSSQTSYAKYNNCVNNILNGTYKLLAISLKVALEGYTDINICIERLSNIINISKKKNIGIILITDCMADRLNYDSLTSSLISYVKYQIELNYARKNIGNTVITFVSRILDLSSNRILYKDSFDGEYYRNFPSTKYTGLGWIEN